MTRAPLLAAAAAAAALLLALPASADAASGLRLTKANGPAFPVRTFVLSLPNSVSLPAGAFHVTENGNQVADLKVEAASKASARTFGVVLVLDTSWSMHGGPLAAALAAEQSFKAERNPNEQLGVIDFNQTTRVVLPLTTSASRISTALEATPTLAVGTHLLDAVGRAEAMLRVAHIRSGSIIVLSDGADTGSTKTLSQVAQVAQALNARIYTVGLTDRTYDPQTLRRLATAGHGEYVPATAAGLAPLFTRLGQIISNEYLVRYKSLALPQKNVRVDVSVGALGTATTNYLTPRLAVGSTAGHGTSAGTGILTSTATMVIVAILLAAMLTLSGISLMPRQKSKLPARVAEFVSIRELQRDHGAAAANIVAGAQTVRKDAWTRFGEALEIAGIGVEPEVLAGSTVAGTALVFIILFAATGSAWWALFALAVPYFVREWVVRKLKRHRSRFAEQLPDALQVIASALRAGHSFAGSLAVVVEGASEPMRSEMHRVVADEQLGLPIQRSLGVVADRMASSDVDQLALVAELQRQSGGDMAEVIDRVAETVRERFDLKRLVDTLTTQGRMSRWIVSGLPIVIVLALELTNPGYFHPLISSTGGRVVVGLAAGWAVLGSLVIKKIIEIEV